jgi:hypothetical protein
MEVWHGKQEMRVARVRVPRTGKMSGFTTSTSRASGTVQSTLGVGGCGREIFASVTYSLQFAKVSAATLSQQEKNNTQMICGAGQIYPALSVQWIASPRGDEPSASSSRWP